MQRILTEAVGVCIEDIVYGNGHVPYSTLLQEDSHSQGQEQKTGRNLGHFLFMTGMAVTSLYTYTIR